MSSQEADDLLARGVVGGQVVQDDVDILAGVRLDGFLEEPEEVGAVASWGAEPEYPAGAYVQRREQVGGAVPDVVGGALLGGAEGHRQRRLGAVQGLDLRFLVDREDHGTSGWVEVQPDDVGDFLGERGAVQEEIFGPVLTVQPFGSEDEAVAMANGSPYGLAAGLQTQNVARAPARPCTENLTTHPAVVSRAVGPFGASANGWLSAVWQFDEADHQLVTATRRHSTSDAAIGE